MPRFLLYPIGGQYLLVAGVALVLFGLLFFGPRRDKARGRRRAVLVGNETLMVFLVLLFFAMIGGMALVSAQEFLTLFVAFELLSLPLVLTFSETLLQSGTASVILTTGTSGAPGLPRFCTF
mgnify:CR=1 FL=1